MGNSRDTILPFHTCKRFQRLLLQQNIYTDGSVTNSFSGVPLNTFMEATEAEIRNIIYLSPVNACEPLPTWLLKECIAELVPLITDIVICYYESL